MSLNATSNQLFALFSAMEKRYHPNNTNGPHTLTADEAYNAFNIIKNEQPNLINVLPDDIKNKFSNGLTQDLFWKMDPLGVADGFINQEEFTKGIEAGTKEDDANVNLGNHGRGDLGFSPESLMTSGYGVKNADGKFNAQVTSQNIIADFENLLNGEPGSIVNGNVNKQELQIVISKYQTAGQTDRKRVAQWMLDHYADFKNANGDIDVSSCAAGFKSPTNSLNNLWE